MQISPDGQLAPTPVLTKHARDQYEASLPETKTTLPSRPHHQ